MLVAFASLRSLSNFYSKAPVFMVRFKKIQRDFLWGGRGLEKKPHLVKWEVVCSNKMKDSLGVRSLSNLNRAILGKWSWCFVKENGALWKQVISRKYGVKEGGWCTRELRDGYGMGF